MNIILIKDSKLGKVDEIITVKDGYGQNFIINKGLGVLATEQLVLSRNDWVILKKSEEEASKSKSNDLKVEIEDIFLNIQREFNNGKMFGSIGNKDISDELSKININVSKKDIKLNKIYSIGNYTALISCGNGINASLNINVEES